MKRWLSTARLLVLACLLAVLLGSCFADSGTAPPPGSQAGAHTSGGSSGSNGTGGANGEGARAGEAAGGEDDGDDEPSACLPRTPAPGAKCRTAISGEPLPGRAVAAETIDRTVFVDDLAARLASRCGACHVGASLGGFAFKTSSFAVDVDERVLHAMKSNARTCEKDKAGNKLDPKCFPFMPPAEAGGKPWSERAADPGDDLQPIVSDVEAWIDAGRPSDTFSVAAATSDLPLYSFTEEQAQSLTNLGTCIPDPGLVATSARGCEMDARFRAMTRREAGTPAERIGLPTTLDQTDLDTFDSEQLARDGVIAYVPAYPLWTDDAGKLRMIRLPYGKAVRYNAKIKQFQFPANTRFYKTFLKKIRGEDGGFTYRKIETRLIVSRPNGRSLFGTYAWNDNETQAELVTEPQNDSAPFRDKVTTLVVDERILAEVEGLHAQGKVRDVTREADNRGALRRYAFPSRERCIQCHMGSASESFLLGFSPLQVNPRACRRAAIEKEGHCDAGQYEPAEGDEVTQLERLISYGVISGYDAANPVRLEDAQGTVHHPRQLRTPEELLAQGYMLGNCSHCHNPKGYPSVEHPELAGPLNFLPGTGGGIFSFPLERYSPRIFRGVKGDVPIAYITPSLRDAYGSLDWTPKYTKATGAGVPASVIDAPWRSLIYRNVDTPYTYVDDSAIYPHMPLDSPGFDCRAPRILGDWMVSIPAVRKNPDKTEDLALGERPSDFTDLAPQPYREVRPGDEDYEQGRYEASQRLATYRTGQRYDKYCPDTSDIVDLNVLRNATLQIPRDGEVSTLPNEGVPDKPHWAIIDLTDPPGPWNPRRGGWSKLVVSQDYSDEQKIVDEAKGTEKVVAEERLSTYKRIIPLLQTASLTPAFRAFANTKLPFGLWKIKPECDFADVAKSGDFDGVKRPRPRWMPKATDAPVYEATPGSVVFNTICFNCHGVDADSRGRQAQTLAEMTGGKGRVANFRDGMFGPFGKDGANRATVFPSEDAGARYLAWMALGGTTTVIPTPILNLVRNTPVLGLSRANLNTEELASANMLQLAQMLCRAVGAFGTSDLSLKPDGVGLEALHGRAGLIFENGDGELWAKLCTFGNPAPIHAARVVFDSTRNAYGLKVSSADSFWAAAYPANSPVGDVDGKTQPSLDASNHSPWCVVPATEAAALTWQNAQTTLNGGALPLCPPAVLVETNRFVQHVDPESNRTIADDLDKWAARGAINAGFAVFLYLDEMISKGKGRDIRYDECELRHAAAETP